MSTQITWAEFAHRFKGYPLLLKSTALLNKKTGQPERIEAFSIDDEAVLRQAYQAIQLDKTLDPKDLSLYNLSSIIPATKRQEIYKESVNLFQSQPGEWLVYWGLVWDYAKPNDKLATWLVKDLRTHDMFASSKVSPDVVAAKESAKTTESEYVVDTGKSVAQQIEDALSVIPSNLILPNLQWKAIFHSILTGNNMMFVGPSGTGKSVIAMSAAKLLGRPVRYFNLGSTQDPRSALVGMMQYKEETGTKFVLSSFARAIQEPNTVIVLDETSRAHPEAINILLTVLDPNQRYLQIDEDPSIDKIKVAENVTFISTANEGVEYTSTRRMDRALKDRFPVILEIVGLNADAEMRLMQQKFNIKAEKLKKFFDVIKAVRKESENKKIASKSFVSTRSIETACKQLVDGFTLKEVLELSIFPCFSNEGGTSSERTLIKQSVQALNLD